MYSNLVTFVILLLQKKLERFNCLDYSKFKIMYKGTGGECCTRGYGVLLYLCTLCTGEHTLLVLVVQEDKM